MTLYDTMQPVTPLITPEEQDRARLRSRTFPGIAAACADQWGRYARHAVAA